MKTGISWIDLRLGVRMLWKNPGITFVGGLAMAVAIAIGAAMFGFSYALLNPRLPLDEGHRIVAVENRDVWSDSPRSPSLHDFAAWRQELRTVREVSAYRNVTRNLIAPDGSAEPVRLAEMSASGFRVARVAPALGRPLVEEDERAGAPPVVVIGHDVWRTRFNGDPRILGQTVRLGNAVHTVVGVMPEGFAFPMNHGWWIPLRLSPGGHEPGEGPEVFVFGRLAPGAGWEQAQAEAGRRGPAGGGRVPGHPRGPAAPCAELHLSRHGRAGHRVGAHPHPRADQPAAGGGGRERGGAGLREDGHAAGRDRHPHRPGRQPPPHRGAALCRGAGAGRRPPPGSCSPAPACAWRTGS